MIHESVKDKPPVMHPGERKSVSVWELVASFAKFKAAIQKSNDARSLGDAPSGNRSRNWNGALDAYRHMTPVEQNQNEKQKDALSGLGITKEAIGLHGLPMHPLFGGDILRR
jgi:hypothetical protein